MKIMTTVMVTLTSFNVSAGGAALGKDDLLVSLSIILFLTLILVIVYLADFINKIRRDKDYRDHLRARVVNLISTVRAIFAREKKVEGDKQLEFASPLGA